MAKTIRRLILVVLVLAAAGAIVYLLWPGPVEAQTEIVSMGPMRVTVDEDGRTRIKERFVVSAPLAGRLARITLKEGDAVHADATIVAAINPSDPTLLDPRARAEAEARVRAAESALERASAQAASVRASLELAQSELQRLQQAGASGASSPIELERAQSTSLVRTQEARAAKFAEDIACFDLDLAKAALVRGEGDGDPQWRFEIAAPVDGRVLRVFQESAAVVSAGTPLIEIGDPADLELVVDVLSSDAVPIRPGAEASLEQWGGDEPLHGRVRLVEPAAFTKISALGVEEQRVSVIIDLTDPAEARQGLGDAFRIEARITVWDEPSVLRVPTGALFRDAESWAVFAVREGRAHLQRVQIGQRNGEQAQVLDGLGEGDEVVVYPSDRVQEGVKIEPRNHQTR